KRWLAARVRRLHGVHEILGQPVDVTPVHWRAQYEGIRVATQRGQLLRPVGKGLGRATLAAERADFVVNQVRLARLGTGPGRALQRIVHQFIGAPVLPRTPDNSYYKHVRSPQFFTRL